MFLAKLDAVAHFLYCPGMLGRRFARARWYHNLHLIPGGWLAYVCDRYEARLTASLGDASDWVKGAAIADHWEATGRYDEWPQAVPSVVMREWDNPDDAVYDFYEDDEPVADVIAAFDRGDKHLTGRD